MGLEPRLLLPPSFPERNRPARWIGDHREKPLARYLRPSLQDASTKRLCLRHRRIETFDREVRKPHRRRFEVLRLHHSALQLAARLDRSVLHPGDLKLLKPPGKQLTVE